MVGHHVPTYFGKPFLKDPDPEIAQGLAIEIDHFGGGPIPGGAKRCGPPPLALHPVGTHDIETARARFEVVDEEAEPLENAAGSDDALLQQTLHIGRTEGEVLARRETIRHGDLEKVRRENKGASFEYRAERLVDGFFGPQRLATILLGQQRGRGNRTVVGKIHDVGIVDRRDIESVLLPRRGRAETRTHTGAHGELFGKAYTPRDFSVDRPAEVRKILDASGDAEVPVKLNVPVFEIPVAGEIATIPVAYRKGTEARETVRPGREALICEQPLGPGSLIALNDLEALLTPFAATREIDVFAQGIREIQVEVYFLLVVDPGVEVRRTALVGNVRRSTLVAAGLIGP